MTLKVLTSIIVLGKAYDLISNKPKEKRDPEKNKSETEHKDKDQSEIYSDSSHILIQSSFVDSLGPEIEKPVDANMINSLKNKTSDFTDTSDLLLNTSDDGDHVTSSQKGQKTAHEDKNKDVLSSETESYVEETEIDNSNSGIDIILDDRPLHCEDNIDIIGDHTDSNISTQDELRHRKTQSDNDDIKNQHVM